MEVLMIAGIAIGLSLMTQIVTKLLVNEKMVDGSREEMKSIQKNLKGKDPKSKEFSELQERMLDLNFKLMKQQLKPMFVTFIPYILVFYFVGNMFAFVPFAQGSFIEVSISGRGDVSIPCIGLNDTIKGYKETVELEELECTAVMNGRELSIDLNGSEPFSTEVNSLKLKMNPPKKVFISLPFSLPLVGSEIGWLGTFIMISLPTSLILQRILKGKYLRKWD
ncbi:MAG TPA: DUF106 domain-containing protein [Candidatus Woesearchaeota archaeon]|nr:DUF106 domain-containing protein [Candidatus Woesearchaeota archaeon]